MVILCRWQTSCNCGDNYKQSSTINELLTLSIDDVVRSIDYFEIGESVRNKTSETHQQTNAFIYR